MSLRDQTTDSTILPRGGRRALLSSLLLLAMSVPAQFATAQTINPSRLIVTPSAYSLLVNETASFVVNGADGRPVPDAQWSIEPEVAELQIRDGELEITAKSPGHAILTARVENQSASASIEIFAGPQLPTGTIRWTVEPTPGYEALILRQAVPNGGETPDFYSVEWSRSANALLRAFRGDGRQMWAVPLASMASPQTLKHRVMLRSGLTTLRGQVVTDIRQIISGLPESAVQSQRLDASQQGLPLDGKYLLLRDTGDDFGGLLIAERGRFRDSLVDINGSDGSELWRYRSGGRLSKDWTVNRTGDVAIVEYLLQPVSSALIVLNGKTGEVRFRVPFPTSSTIIRNYKQIEGNDLANIRPSMAGSVFTSTDGYMYVQVETHNESQDLAGGKLARWSFENSLSLLQVTPEGETDWKMFQHIHADGDGGFHVQARVFAGESIPDGLGGELSAWTYFFPGNKEGAKPHFEARLTRLGPSGQNDYTMPFAMWSGDPTAMFDENMVLGEDDTLYATNTKMLINFHIPSGELKWVRQPPSGDVEIHWSTRGGGVLVSNRGQLMLFDPQGNGMPLAETVLSAGGTNIGFQLFDPIEHKPTEVLQLRDVQLSWFGKLLAVEDGAPNGHGRVMEIARQ